MNMEIGKLLSRVLVCLVLSPVVVAAQTAPLIPELGGLLPPSSGDQEIHVSASYKLTSDGRFGELSVTADLVPGWHVYSVTQKAGGPMRTQIEIESKSIELLAPFKPNRQPKIKKLEFFKVPVEEHDEQVIWTAPFQVIGATADELVIRGDLKGQVCNEQGGCIPLSTMDTKFAAQQKGVLAKAPATAATPRRTPPLNRVAPIDESLALSDFQVPTGSGFREVASRGDSGYGCLDGQAR